MKKIIALIGMFFMFFSYTANAAYTGSYIYNSVEKTFEWAEKNISPLGNTDSVASDYCVIAFSRAGKAFDYKKYVKITDSKTPATKQDAFRIIMANTAAGGEFSDKKVGEYIYNADFKTVSDKASAIIAIQSGEYQVKSNKTDINRLVVNLMEMQNSDGSFEGDILATAKGIIALSFFSGNSYILKGDQIGERFTYDVNAAILRGVNYLQNNKNPDYGFGSVINNAFVVMALDSAGVDSDNDPGFSDGTNSTFSALISEYNPDGSIGDYPDDTAIAMCALVSHLRAMQGNSQFFALRTEDMPYNPNDYVEDINRSGEGLKIETQDKIVISETKSAVLPDSTEKTHNVETSMPPESESNNTERKSFRLLTVFLVIATVLIVTATVTKIAIHSMNVRKRKNYHMKKSDDSDVDT